MNTINDLRTEERGTRASIRGPFYISDPPPMELGQLLCPHAKGTLIALYGTVKGFIWETYPECLG